jgi:hypothetical protein|tara:strand:+ start:2076 stop:2351 length:276 start_codon:yes stop_codon:yes gene_type:complete
MGHFMVTLKPLKVSGKTIGEAVMHAKMLVSFSPLKMEIDQIMPWPENYDSHMDCTIEAIQAKQSEPSGTQGIGEEGGEQEGEDVATNKQSS